MAVAGCDGNYESRWEGRGEKAINICVNISIAVTGYNQNSPIKGERTRKK